MQEPNITGLDSVLFLLYLISSVKVLHFAAGILWVNYVRYLAASSADPFTSVPLSSITFHGVIRCFNHIAVYPAPTSIELCRSIGIIGSFGPLAICSTGARLASFLTNGGYENATLVKEYLALKDLVPAVQPFIEHPYKECPGLGTLARKLLE